MSDKIEIERQNLDNFIADTIKEVSMKSFNDGIVAGVDSIKKAFEKIEEESGNKKLTISEFLVLINSMTEKTKEGMKLMYE